MSSRNNHILCLIILAVTFIFAFIHTACREWVGDDICYAAVFGTEDRGIGNVELIENASDIFRSQWSHYFHDNGRVPVHVIVQFFVGIAGKTCFAFCNAAVFVLVVALLCRVIFGHFSWRNPWALLLTAICMFTLFPTASEVRLGPWFGAAMAVNYLWSAAAFLLFLIVLRSDRTFGRVGMIGLLSLCFFLGWSNEAFSIPLLGTLLISWRHLSKRQRLMTMVLGVGALLIVVSPGTLNRAMVHGEGKTVKDMVISLIDCYTGAKLFWILVLAFVSGIVFIRRSTLSFIKENRFLSALLAVEVVFSIFAHSEAHSLTCIELTSLILLGRIAAKLLPINNNIFILSGVLLVFIGFESAVAVENSRVRKLYQEAVERYLTSEDGVTYIENPNYLPITKNYTDNYFHPLTPHSYFATRFSAVYGRKDMLPTILSKKDYLIIRNGEGLPMKGSANAIEGDDWYIVPYIADGEYTAYFDDDSFMADFSPLRKAVYKYLLSSKKAPKKLEAEHIRTSSGEYILLRKLLSRPTRIEFTEESE